jgi:hypothetical protein
MEPGQTRPNFSTGEIRDGWAVIADEAERRGVSRSKVIRGSAPLSTRSAPPAPQTRLRVRSLVMDRLSRDELQKPSDGMGRHRERVEIQGCGCYGVPFQG